MQKWNIGLAFLFASSVFEAKSSVMAGDSHYTCTIVSASRVTDQGTLVSHWIVNAWIGQHFTTDRETGRIVGGPLDNSKMQIELIDKGSQEMSFKVFARSQQKTHTTYLQVEEFQTTESKPFIGTTTLYYAGVYTGTCR